MMSAFWSILNRMLLDGDGDGPLELGAQQGVVGVDFGQEEFQGRAAVDNAVL
jgi:hypothetical protein